MTPGWAQGQSAEHREGAAVRAVRPASAHGGRLAQWISSMTPAICVAAVWFPMAERIPCDDRLPSLPLRRLSQYLWRFTRGVRH
ncbi:uncharacterized protein RMCB_3660 [Mycolicibacterium brisbanense]|uniref:Uncharacterized protein n=1 Tax=Mycolicibacterium brisbanense TaxID=146020 RepID=A0A100W0U7_9MYCO|nr:uncharacterized protein RMCB_3660 [Mycolicibacterium brisbanense]